MTTLAITRGLPASGKTTLARGWVEAREVAVRVNRDDLRHNLFGVYWGLTYEQEEQVSRAQKAAVRALLRGGSDVIVDDTNLRAAHAKAWRTLAAECGALFEVIDLPVDPQECTDRDFARMQEGERGVGHEVIRQMCERYGITAERFLPPLEDEPVEEASYVYVPDETKPHAWLVDIDGTLALMRDGGRGPFDWHRVGEDDVNRPVAALVEQLYPGPWIVLMSGRDSVCRDATVGWLKENEIPFDALFMRPFNDTRKDAVVKLELFRELVAPNYNVRGVIDDRDQVVAMWRSIGLTCFQCAEGAF